MRKKIYKFIVLFLGTILAILLNGTHCTNVTDNGSSVTNTSTSNKPLSTSSDTSIFSTTTSTLFGGIIGGLYGTPYVEFFIDGVVNKNTIGIEGLKITVKDASGSNTYNSTNTIFTSPTGSWNLHTYDYTSTFLTPTAHILVEDIDGSINGLYIDSSVSVVLNRTDNQTNWLYKRYELHNIYIELQEAVK